MAAYDVVPTRVVRSEFLTTKGYIRRQAWTDAAAPADNAVHADITLPNSGTLNVTTAITNPDVARNVTIKGNHADSAGNVVITGTNIRDEAITETIALNGSTEVQGNKAFKTVTNINVPAKVGSTGTLARVGIGKKLGLDRKMRENAVILVTADGTYETTRPTVAYSSSAIESNTLSPNTDPDASKDFVAYFISGEIY